MRIKMNTLSAGPNGTRYPGAEYDVPTSEAESLIAGRFAVAVEAPAPAPVEEAPAPSKGKGKGKDKVEDKVEDKDKGEGEE